uniref:Cytochrome P450 n=1 Tax=Stomoxys calcitrans TaxID=35570 RepID=A0A1I8Q2A8_STOCA
MFIISIIIVLAASYVLIKRHYSKWKLLGIPSDEEPSIFFGSLDKVSRQELPLGLALAEIYQRFEHKLVGIFLLFKPTILVRDAELTRQIMTNAFESFHDRGIYVDEEYNPMSANLLSLKGQKWRALRAKLTPSFSSGKLKAMFETVDDVAQRLIDHMSRQLEEEQKEAQRNTLEIKSLLITVAFILGRLGVRDPVIYRLRDIVQQTIEHREKNGVMRKDLLQLLIQLRNTGEISEDNEQLWNVIKTSGESLKSISIDIIASNAFLFYMAGSETTAATTSYTIYELSMNPRVLQKAQEEVDKAMEKHGLGVNGRLTYEAIQDMAYLDLCVMETLRKYPAAPFLNRECTLDYQVPDTKFTIKKGTGIIVSVFGLHRDPEYFPKPMDYIPERFAKDSNDYNPMAYLPFGQGPRQCIAQRMGIVNVKTALAKILANFNIKTIPRKEVEFKFHTAPVLVPKDGLNVSFSKRKK